MDYIPHISIYIVGIAVDGGDYTAASLRLRSNQDAVRKSLEMGILDHVDGEVQSIIAKLGIKANEFPYIMTYDVF
jgi:hypothetical protein